MMDIFVGEPGCFDKDLTELDGELTVAAPWSQEKAHLMSLVALMINNEALPLIIRRRAAQVIYEHSDERKVVETMFKASIEEREKVVKEWLYGE